MKIKINSITADRFFFDLFPKFFLFAYLIYFCTFNYSLELNPALKTAANLSALIFFGLFIIFRLKCIFFGVFEKSFAMFLAICVLSIFFAIAPDETAYRCSALFFIFFIVMFLHTYLAKIDGLELFIFALCAGGISLAAYNFYYYGPAVYLTTLGSKRIGAEIMNVNTIGNFTSMSTLICFWYVYYKKKIYYIVPMLMCALVSLGVGSRKSVVFLILGCCLLYILKGGARQKLMNLIFMLISLAGFIALLQTPLFGRTAERFTTFIFLFTGDAPVDHSTALRVAMVEGGLKDFLQSPFMGVGLDNTHYLTRKYIGEDFYLHNNFVELLASVGLLGTLPFYFLRFYPIVKLIQPALNHDAEAILLESLLIIHVVLDFGQVSYIGTETYFYTLAGYLKVAKLKARAP